MTMGSDPTPQVLSLQDPPDVLSQVRLIATDVDGTLTVAGGFQAPLLQCLCDLRAAGFKVLLITGRSAGWVQGLSTYLPVDGAIAENGGVLVLAAPAPLQVLCPLEDQGVHRQGLSQVFAQIQREFPHYPDLRPASDNRFRLTDWTFDQQGFSREELEQIQQICLEHQYGFTYSSIQCHIKPLECDKGSGLIQVLEQQLQFSISPHQVVTVGDSPNDASLFDPARFPLSVGVANVLHYQDQLPDLPTYITPGAEGLGFQQLAQILLAHRKS